MTNNASSTSTAATGGSASASILRINDDSATSSSQPYRISRERHPYTLDPFMFDDSDSDSDESEGHAPHPPVIRRDLGRRDHHRDPERTLALETVRRRLAEAERDLLAAAANQTSRASSHNRADDDGEADSKNARLSKVRGLLSLAARAG